MNDGDYVELKENSVKNLKNILNSIPEQYDDATVRVYGEGDSIVVAVELDIGPEWVVWLYTKKGVSVMTKSEKE